MFAWSGGGEACGGGGEVTVDYPNHMFLAMPRIQLCGPRSWQDVLDETIHQLRYQFVKNGKTTRIRKMHLYQIMDLDDMESLDGTINATEDKIFNFWCILNVGLFGTSTG